MAFLASGSEPTGAGRASQSVQVAWFQLLSATIRSQWLLLPADYHISVWINVLTSAGCFESQAPSLTTKTFTYELNT